MIRRSCAYHFQIIQIKKISRSDLSAEANAFADLYDGTYAPRSQMEHALSRALPMHVLTGSKSLYDVVSKVSNASEKRLMLDIHVAQHAYKLHEISNIGFVRGNHNLADGLTKASMHGAQYRLITIERHEIEAEQWIVRDHA